MGLGLGGSVAHPPSPPGSQHVSWRRWTPCWGTPWHCQQLPTCWGKRGSLPVSQRVVTTISHSEWMRIEPAGTCLHHSSPGPGNGPGHQVPPGFLLCLPGKTSIRRQHWRDPVISSMYKRDGLAERLRQGYSLGSGSTPAVPKAAGRG